MTHQNEFATTRTNSFSITEPMLQSLRLSKPWVFFLSILGFISCGLMLIGGLINMFSMFGIGSIPFILVGVLNLLMALLYLFPSLFLFRFASSIDRLLNGGGAKEMEDALSNQKSFWKFVGILALVGIGCAILGIAAAIIIPMFAASSFAVN